MSDEISAEIEKCEVLLDLGKISSSQGDALADFTLP